MQNGGFGVIGWVGAEMDGLSGFAKKEWARNHDPHCAGALIFLEKRNRPNQMMRIAERTGSYDRRTLDMKAPVR